MEYQKNMNESGGTYSSNKDIRFKTPQLRSDNASFFRCVTKINGKLFEDAQDLDIVMPLYNLLYYSKNYRKTTGSLWNYYMNYYIMMNLILGITIITEIEFIIQSKIQSLLTIKQA